MPESVSWMERMGLGDRIGGLRRSRGMTQEDLASKSGLSVATIQRLERGQSASPTTIASVAAAFGLDASSLSTDEPAAESSAAEPYLPLIKLTSGKALIDLMAKADAMDFDYTAVEDTVLAELIVQFHDFCSPKRDRQDFHNIAARIRLDMEAAKLLRDLASKDLCVSGETYDRTCHEVDDEDGWPAVLMGKWDETCLVIRIGSGQAISTANVMSNIDKWTNVSDPKIIFPKSQKAGGS